MSVLSLPLKAARDPVGVLCIACSEPLTLDPDTVGMLLSMGNQIATAIERARLYEETRALSLQDPLTSIANRRLMEICSIVTWRNRDATMSRCLW